MVYVSEISCQVHCVSVIIMSKLTGFSFFLNELTQCSAMNVSLHNGLWMDG